MKYLVIFLVLAISIMIPLSSFAQVPNCTFGGTMTPFQEKFAKDLAVKEFVKQNPNATKSMLNDESGNPKNQFVLSAQNGKIQETLILHFGTDENGCYVPSRYHYSYNDGTMDVTIINTIGNFTEIMNLIKSDSKTIDDFYPNGCSRVDLKHSISNGKIYGICKQGTSITVLADTYSDGAFTVDIPIEMVYSLPSSDCIPTGEFSVTGDIGSPKYEIAQSNIGNLVEVQLDEGFHRIRIGGYMIIPSPAPGQYCGIVEGYDKPYLPPLDQIDHGMKPSSVKCNSELVLVLKYDGSPACVTESTKLKLIERGWTTSATTVTIYSNFEQNRDRTYTNPRNVIIDLEKDNSIKWVNNAGYAVQVYDYENKSWSTGSIIPSMNDFIQFNSTGYYEFAVESANDRHFGKVVVISENTNSLPVETRMKMGMAIVSNDLGKNPALIGVVTGDVNDGVKIDINKKELEKRDDAESFYYNLYNDMIPFDVPITIDFSEPFKLLE